ncbi:competence protein CoiA [Weissella confusa]|uniref:competence protein CoiA n=1 Tax=Weissella confusa TaxID=1583 RepID=UPI0022DF7824|nr:competence protein CoiA family protein [Weissella confusa]
MFIAKKRGSTELVKANLAEKTAVYVCPGCDGEVQVKQGTIKTPHFSHVTLRDCQSLAEGESSEHLLGKLQLADFFENLGGVVEMEVWLPEIKQRPDLVVSFDNVKIAVEFQCAPITAQRVSERTRGFETLGMDVVWVLGPTYQRKKLQQATWAKFVRMRGGRLQVAFWRPKKQRVEWQEWWRLDCRNRVREQDVGDPYRQLLKLQQLVTQRSEVSRRWQKQLYRQGRSLVGMPWICHRLQAMPGGARASQWELSLGVLLALEKGSQTVEQLQSVLIKQVWFEFGATEQTVAVNLWLSRLLAEWQDENVITQRDDRVWLNQPPEWYSDYQHKLTVLN